MMGIKLRVFTAITNLSLGDLVPQDHFYRHVQRSLDLAFVRDLVRTCYAGGGRPSIDPVVFFKLQLVMFFEGIRSERRLMAVAADRLSVRWFLGYEFTSTLPHINGRSTARVARHPACCAADEASLSRALRSLTRLLATCDRRMTVVRCWL